MMIELAAAAAVCAGASDPDAAAIRDARAAFNVAIAEKNAEAIAGVLAENVTLVTGTDSDLFDGRDAQLQIWRDDFADDARLIYVRRPVCITRSPLLPIAMETGTWRGAPDAGDDFVAGDYVAKWRRIDGQWRLEAEIFATTNCSGALCPDAAETAE